MAHMHLLYNYTFSVFKLIFLGKVIQTYKFSKSKNMYLEKTQRLTVKTKGLGKQLANDTERQGHTIKKKVQVLLCIAAVVHVNCQTCVCVRVREREREREREKRERAKERICRIRANHTARSNFMSFVSLWFARAKPGMRTNHDKVKNFVN